MIPETSDVEPGNANVGNAAGADSGFLGALGGIFNKVLDKAVDTYYPTGNQNGAAVANQIQSNKQIQQAQPFDYKPLIIGGSIVAAVLIGVVIIKKL